MSKRFGRNQKRKLQESIRQCQEAKEMTDGLNRWLSSRHEKDVSTLKRVEEVLGKNNALLEPKLNFCNAPFPGQRHVEVPSMQIPMQDCCPTDTVTTLQLHSKVLYLLNLIKDEDPIKDAIHMKFQYMDGSVGYAISKEAMYQIPGNLLIERMSEEMARLLVQNFNQETK